MDENAINAVVGQLYLALVAANVQNAQLNEVIRLTAEAQAAERPENISDFPAQPV